MAKSEEKTKAILRYQIKTKSKIENHRIICDIKKATHVMPYVNIHGKETGNIYITSNKILFMKVDGKIALPHHFSPQGTLFTLEKDLAGFINGQEELKDYIAERSPETYLKFFNDAKEV